MPPPYPLSIDSPSRVIFTDPDGARVSPGAAQRARYRRRRSERTVLSPRPSSSPQIGPQLATHLRQFEATGDNRETALYLMSPALVVVSCRGFICGIRFDSRWRYSEMLDFAGVSDCSQRRLAPLWDGRVSPEAILRRPSRLRRACRAAHRAGQRLRPPTRFSLVSTR
jgi:hypothetical protein